jgi:hypothetical protein
MTWPVHKSSSDPMRFAASVVCANVLPKTLRMPPPVGLTWHWAHLRPICAARYGSACDAPASANNTRAPVRRARFLERLIVRLLH